MNSNVNEYSQKDTATRGWTFTFQLKQRFELESRILNYRIRQNLNKAILILVKHSVVLREIIELLNLRSLITIMKRGRVQSDRK